MNILDIAIAKKLAGGGGGSGTDNYNDLSNLPKINDTTLSGNKSSSALGLQSEITSDSKLASDLVDDTNQDNKFVTSTEKNTWNGKQNAIDADHKLSSDLVDDANHTNKFVTSTEKNTWNAKQNAIDSDHKLSSDLVDDANKTNKFVTSTEKNTWNAKQNAIDSEHKLSSSLVSFTDAEAAALASGIDSSKVGQISTNQTNILYALNNGVKNLLNYDAWKNDTSIIGGTAVWENNGVTLTATATNCYTDQNVPVDARIKVSSGDKVVLSWDLERSSENYNGYAYIFPNGDSASAISATAPTGKLEYTVPSNVTYLTYRFSITTGSGSILKYKNIMISYKSVYDASPTYEPPAKPNYDLTRLEAEDRASLAEVVDSGAKNLINCSVDNIKSLNSTSTYSWNGNTVTAYGRTATVNSDGTITVAAGTGSAEFWLKVANYTYASGVSYVLSGCPANGSTTTYYMESDNLNLRDLGSGVVINSATTDALYVVVKTTGSTPTLTFKPMLCTKAAFGVSQKFVPYRLPYDTVAYRAKSITTLHSMAISADSTDKTVTLSIPTTDNFSLFCLTNDTSIGSISMVAVLGSNRYGGIDTSTQTYGLIVNNNTVTVKVKAYNQAILIWNKDLDISW